MRLEQMIKDKKKVCIGLIGAGDVGRTILEGLFLHRATSIDSLIIYTPNRNESKRLELEFNQCRSLHKEPLTMQFVQRQEDLLQANMILFCAAKSIPGLQSKETDVRQAQLKGNWEILKNWIDLLNKGGFRGVLGIVSDPIDELCAASVTIGGYDPLRIIGLGLGVMYARARYYGNEKVLVYGPHGNGLLVINDEHAFDPNKSRKLTNCVVKANLSVRALGYKPYIAPAISSVVLTLNDLFEGRSFHASLSRAGTFFGARYMQYVSEFRMYTPKDRFLQQQIKKVYDDQKNVQKRTIRLLQSGSF